MKNVLFDFDGTLMDTWLGIKSTIEATLRAMEVPFEEKTITQALVGVSLVRVFEKLLGSDSSKAAQAAQKYREFFPESGMPRSIPFEGAARMLEELQSRGRTLFLVTARNENITRLMLKEHDLAGSFAWVRGERESEVLDGKAHMVAEVLERFALDPGDCVMVGDRYYDIEAARNNGVATIGVTYGYGTDEELMEAGAIQLAGSIEELREILVNDDGL